MVYLYRKDNTVFEFSKFIENIFLNRQPWKGFRCHCWALPIV